MAGAASPIHEYAKDGNIAGVLGELAKGTSVDARDPVSNLTPLMEAVSSCKAEIHLVRLLIEKGANVNAMADHAPTLSLAIQADDLAKIRILLDAGADIHYQCPHGYDAIINGVHAFDAQLLPIVQLLIDRGANLNGVTSYAESGLSVASRRGRFDVIRALLAAGANPTPLQWSPLMYAIALGSLEDARSLVENGVDLSARDFWSRTPWLLSLQTGDVAKAKLLLAAGAKRSDRGRCGKVPLMYPIIGTHTEMLRWLLSEGFDPNDTDEFGGTPLLEAAEMGATESAQILIDAGADIHRKQYSGAAIKRANNLEMVRLLVKKGADLNDISDEMRAALTKLPFDERIHASHADYRAAKNRRFGGRNPEKMNPAFWRSMITSGVNAYTARKHFDDTDDLDQPVWCFRRFGKSITELPDGRIIEIAGEHEDHYDPDFCIYNDVIVHHGDGTFDICGYPRSCFPPTDFHTATLVGKFIYIIGSLGYPGERKYGHTPVYRLNVDSLEIEKVNTSGEKPGWISEHKAVYDGDDRIRISGGKRCALEGDRERYTDNSSEYTLDLGALVWARVAPPSRPPA